MPKRVTFAVLLLLLAACERKPQSDEFGNLLGPLHASAELNRHGLLGMRPGMRLERAAAILAGQGYSAIPRTEAQRMDDGRAAVRQQHFWIPAPQGSDAHEFPQSVKLSYVRHEDGAQEVVAIGHLQRITKEARGNAEATRRDILRRFGRPSLWRQDFYRNEVSDEIDYVASPAFRNQDSIEHLRACHVDWRCEKLLRDYDCREIMRAGRMSALKISFGQDGNRVFYELSDYRRLYDAQARDGRLAKLNLRGAFCSAPAMGGRPALVVTVP